MLLHACFITDRFITDQDLVLFFQTRKGLEYILEKLFAPEKPQTVITGIPITQNF